MRQPLLLVRPRPLQGESLLGYLLRVCQCNGLEKLAHLFQDAGDPEWTYTNHQQIMQGRRSLAHIAAALGQPAAALSSLAYPTLQRKRFTHVALSSEWEGIDVPSDLLHYRRSPFCPLCLKESSFFRSSWAFSLATTCQQHQCLLVDQCSRCTRFIVWDRSALCRCRCGADLLDEIPVQASRPNLPSDALTLRMAAYIALRELGIGGRVRWRDLLVPTVVQINIATQRACTSLKNLDSLAQQLRKYALPSGKPKNLRRKYPFLEVANELGLNRWIRALSRNK